MAFTRLEAEFRRLHAQGDATCDEDAAGALYARAEAVERLVLVSPATSPVSLLVKVRMMTRWAAHGAPELAPGLREVLAHLGPASPTIANRTPGGTGAPT